MMKAAVCLVLTVVGGALAKPQLPESCLWTGDRSVDCEFDIYSKNYNPVLAAVEISRIPQIANLKFQINVASKTQTMVTDDMLVTIGQSFNSTSVTSLTFVLGSLKKITGEGIAAFSALNPIAKNTLTFLDFDLQINPVDDNNAATIGANLAKFSNLESVTINVKNDYLTGKGLASIVSGLEGYKKLKSLVIIGASSEFSSSAASESIGETLANLKSLRSLHFECSNCSLTDSYYASILERLTQLPSLNKLSVVLEGNKLEGSAFVSTVSSVAAYRKLAMLSVDFSEYFPGASGNNTINLTSVKTAVDTLNKANYQGQLSLNFENSIPLNSAEAYASAFACLKNRNILQGAVKLTTTSIPKFRYNEVTEKSVSVDPSCSDGLKLETDVTGGPENNHFHKCVTCA
jgi:hypothetical protein